LFNKRNVSLIRKKQRNGVTQWFLGLISGGFVIRKPIGLSRRWSKIMRKESIVRDGKVIGYRKYEPNGLFGESFVGYDWIGDDMRYGKHDELEFLATSLYGYEGNVTEHFKLSVQDLGYDKDAEFMDLVKANIVAFNQCMDDLGAAKNWAGVGQIGEHDDFNICRMAIRKRVLDWNPQVKERWFDNIEKKMKEYER
jgi:hypothetical protein